MLVASLSLFALARWARDYRGFNMNRRMRVANRINLTPARKRVWEKVAFYELEEFAERRMRGDSEWMRPCG